MPPDEMLAPSEIESLRQKTRDAIASARKVFAEREASRAFELGSIDQDATNES